MPNNWLTTGLRGAVQHIQVKYPNAGKMKSGTQYQQNMTMKATMKNLYRDALSLLSICC